ncbi:MAG: FAD:protein FMN transferase [Flavobacteriales bacterium]|tara:strand:- start:1532 stop:2521 length:990 start_codon:yes stop_codon:yes gene_type:complete
MKYIFFAFLAFLFSCTSSEVNTILVQNTGQTQGTFYHIQYMSENGESYKNQIDSLLLEIDSSLSTYVDFSIISRANRGEKVKVDQMFLNVFYAADKVFLESEGLFDCSIAPLTNYWGFGPDNDVLKVDSVEVAKRLKLVDYSKLEIINDSLMLPTGMQLDYNSIAQGYSVDVVADYLSSKGIVDYLVEIGGELTAKGVNSDSDFWWIGIDKPSEETDYNSRYQIILPLENSSLATSGNYRKYKEIDGIKYSHTISTETGYFAKNRMLSVTVIHPSCMLSDAYATAFMCMGIKQSKEFARDNPDLKLYFVYSDKNGNWETFSTKNLEISE